MSRRRQHADMEINLTSLIDVTFLLIVFFVLVSRINEFENVELDLPAPTDPATMLPEPEHQVALNVIPTTDGQVKSYRLDGIDFPVDEAGLRSLSAHLTGLYVKNPSISVNLRADRATHYEYVERAMQSVSRAARAAQASLKTDLKPDLKEGSINPRVNLVVLQQEAAR